MLRTVAEAAQTPTGDNSAAITAIFVGVAATITATSTLIAAVTKLVQAIRRTRPTTPEPDEQEDA